MALTMFTATSIAEAQTIQKTQQQNPFTLVYEGAVTENVKGKVNIHPVNYKIGEITIPDPRKARLNVIEKAFKKRESIQSRGI